jgi:hypothetical protein
MAEDEKAPPPAEEAVVPPSPADAKKHAKRETKAARKAEMVKHKARKK